MGQDSKVVTSFFDQYGEEKVIHRSRHGLSIRQPRNTAFYAVTDSVGISIGLKIREMREKVGMSLSELAKASGMSTQSPKQRMYEIERTGNKHTIRIGTLYCIAAALGVEVYDLLPTVDEALTDSGVSFHEEKRLKIKE